MEGFVVYHRTRIDAVCLWVACEVVEDLGLNREKIPSRFYLSSGVNGDASDKDGKAWEGGLAKVQSGAWVIQHAGIE